MIFERHKPKYKHIHIHKNIDLTYKNNKFNIYDSPVIKQNES